MRILLIRLSAIGDCVLASPVPQLLRARFPDAHITWAVQARAREVVAGIPGVDDILVWHDTPTRWHGLARALCEARRRSFDVALDLQGLAKAGAFLASCGARRRITGSRSKTLARLAATEIVSESDPLRHAVQNYQHRAAALTGTTDEILRPTVPVTAEHRASAERFLHRHVNGSGRPVIGFNIGASKPAKCWSPVRFAQTADTLLADLDAEGIIFGAAWEVDRAQEMVAASRLRERLHCAAGITSLLEVAALAERCVTFVTADTGPMHIAAAMGVPVVGLFGPSQPTLTGPVGEGHAVVDAVDVLRREGSAVPRAQTHYGRRFGRVDDLSAIMPEHVVAATYAVWPEAEARARERLAAAKLQCANAF